MIIAVDVSPVTRGGAQADARRELSKAIYHQHDDPWPVRVFKAVADWVADLFDATAGHAPGGGAGAIGLVVLLVVLVALARWRLGPLRRTAGAPGPMLSDRTVTAAEHRRAATAAAAQGRWTEAVVERARALARSLEEQDVIAVRPGRTADELRDEVSALFPPHSAVVSRATATFDAVAYGGRPADEQSYQRVVAADEALRELRVVATR